MKLNKHQSDLLLNVATYLDGDHAGLTGKQEDEAAALIRMIVEDSKRHAGPDVRKWHECRHCGRVFDEGIKSAVCPSDDCPSNTIQVGDTIRWESWGVPKVAKVTKVTNGMKTVVVEGGMFVHVVSITNIYPA